VLAWVGFAGQVLVSLKTSRGIHCSDDFQASSHSCQLILDDFRDLKQFHFVEAVFVSDVLRGGSAKTGGLDASPNHTAKSYGS
jgi:hypothetical protein